MDLKASNISLTMESPSQGDAEKAMSMLSQLPYLENAKTGPLENKGTRKRFTLNATVKPLGRQ